MAGGYHASGPGVQNRRPHSTRYGSSDTVANPRDAIGRAQRLQGIQKGRAHVKKLKAMRMFSPGTSGAASIAGFGGGKEVQGTKDALRSAIATHNKQAARHRPAGSPSGGRFY